MSRDLLPPRIHVLAKPTGAACNLDCAYCFFLEKERLYPGSKFRMSDEVLEAYIRQLIEAHRGREVTVAWQGGEPTLMGLDFYRRAVEYQDKYRKPGMVFENTMQTNGTLLDDDWCRFFKENNFLVGISLDGPRELHDTYRRDKGGRGTFDRVMRGLRLLQEHGVEYNVLVAVNRTNADYPLEVYRFLRDEVGASWMQLIPVVERLDEGGQRTYLQQGSRVSERSVRPEQFGRFLIRILDEWLRHDVGRVYVQTFEAAARNWLRLPSSGMCVLDETCGLGLALEHNGDLYSCDHFVEPDYRLGNIMDTPMRELAASAKQVKFGQDKRDTLPRACRECDVLFACHGECPKNRFRAAPRSPQGGVGSAAPRSPQGGVGLTTRDGEPGLNYLCAGWQAFFRRANEPLQMIAMLLRLGRPAAEIMAVMAGKEHEWKTTLARTGPKDPCPCGSGLTYGQCHGWRRPGQGRQQAGKGTPRPQPHARSGAKRG
jgi:uncharacterized protein